MPPDYHAIVGARRAVPFATQGLGEQYCILVRMLRPKKDSSYREGRCTIQQPSKTYRGTWEEILAHRDEIPKTSEVEVRVYEANPITDDDPTIKLLESWIAQAPTDPEAIREAEEDLLEFKRNMNLPRKETGARLHFPEVE